MSRLGELIRTLCPNGVEYKQLEEITNVSRGSRLTKKQLVEKGYPVYHGSLSPLGYYTDYNMEGDTVIVVNTGGIGGVGYSEDRFWCSDGCFTIDKCDLLNNKFLYYYLSGFKDYFISKIRTGGVPTIDRKTVLTIEIPVPPMEVQEEIVRILDKFTQLEAELEAELEARKKQYEHYRDTLLDFTPPVNEKIAYRTMGEIGTFIRGNGLQKKDFTESGVPCIHYGQIYTHYGTFAYQTKSFVSLEDAKKLKTAKSGDIVITTTSENIEDVCKCVAWLGKGNVCIGGHSCAFSHNENPKYIAYFLQTNDFFTQKQKYARGIKVIDIKISDLEKIVIPIPPIEEQERIVGILDKFEAICTDLCEGLPAEIEARRRQYEHYRDKLLSFRRRSA